MERIYLMLMVMVGAAVGSLFRYETYLLVGRFAMPSYYATWLVNMVGSFLIGILFIRFSQIQNPSLELLMITGLLGSFTTFSTFSLDVVKLLVAGIYWQALLYTLSQLILGILFCFLGTKIGFYFFVK